MCLRRYVWAIWRNAILMGSSFVRLCVYATMCVFNVDMQMLYDKIIVYTTHTCNTHHRTHWNTHVYLPQSKIVLRTGSQSQLATRPNQRAACKTLQHAHTRTHTHTHTHTHTRTHIYTHTHTHTSNMHITHIHFTEPMLLERIRRLAQIRFGLIQIYLAR